VHVYIELSCIYYAAAVCKCHRKHHNFFQLLRPLLGCHVVVCGSQRQPYLAAAIHVCHTLGLLRMPYFEDVEVAIQYNLGAAEAAIP
jgi:hypothetical protein